MTTINPNKPDTTFSTATPFKLGDTLTGALNASTDKDYFVFTTTGSQTVQLDFSYSGADLGNWAYSVRVFDANGNALAGGYLGSSNVTSASLNFATPGAGAYYVRVTSSNIYSSAPYTVVASALNATPSDYEHEGNDTQASATAIALDHTYSGQLYGTPDIDDYVVNVDASGMLLVDFRAPTSGGGFGVGVYDAAGTQIDARTVIGSTTLVDNVNARGKYYIHVTRPTNLGKFDSGNYYVTAHLDSSKVLANAASFSGGAPVTASVTATGHNWYKVDLQAGTAYEFSLAGAASQGGTLATPSLLLTTQDGHVLSSAAHLPTYDGSTTVYTADPQIGFVAPYTGTFYLQVDGLGNAGSFTLSQKTDTLPSMVRDLENASSTGAIIHWPSSGATTTITYAFMTDASLATADDQTGFVAMTSAQADVVRQVLAMYSGIANISFQEVSDPTVAGIRFGTADEVATGAGGVTYRHNDSSGNLSHAEVYIANAVSSGSPETSTLTPGGHGFQTLIHETGHALGLKHPGDYNVTTGTAPSPYLPAAWDDIKYSLMSYLHDPDATTNASTPQLLDVAAIQSLYGVRSASTDSFTFAPGSEQLKSVLSGSVPLTLDFSKQTSDNLISLTPGTLSSIGVKADGSPAVSNVALPFSASVKEVFGGSGNDYILAGSNNVKVHLGSGTDTVVSSGTGNTIIGGGGSDTVEYTGSNADFRVLHTAAGFSVGAKTGGGADTLTGVTSLAFKDSTLALSYSDVVEDLYVAYFGRPADKSGWTNFEAALAAAGAPKDIQGLNAAYGTNATVKSLVDAFGTSAESAALYGSGTTADFVEAIYTHVLNRKPDSGGLQYWVDSIDHGGLTKGNAALSIMAGALLNQSAEGLVDGQVVINKMLGASNFTLALDTNTLAQAYAGDAAAAAVRAMLSTISDTSNITAFESTVLSTLASLTHTSVAPHPVAVELIAAAAATPYLA